MLFRYKKKFSSWKGFLKAYKICFCHLFFLVFCVFSHSLNLVKLSKFGRKKYTNLEKEKKNHLIIVFVCFLLFSWPVIYWIYSFVLFGNLFKVDFFFFLSVKQSLCKFVWAKNYFAVLNFWLDEMYFQSTE